MPTFPTPHPILATIDLVAGDVTVVAGERADTTVEVTPSDAAKPADVRAAERAIVDLRENEVLVKATQRWRQLGPGDGGAIDVRIEVPEGSRVHGSASLAVFRCNGRLGDCAVKVSMGHLLFEETGALRLKTGSGDITVQRAAGDAEAETASGTVRIEAVEGTTRAKNSNGDIRLGELARVAEAGAGNGSIQVACAQEGIRVKTANGAIRVDEIVRGEASLQTSFGSLEFGIRNGTAALLDLHTQLGTITNELTESGNPESGERTAEIFARTSFGDITVHRV
ncbi:DUF4097 family beta strand repeat-containing protein [Sciscionella sediminilitoris]|uniref:DUF4097 family beta strand repeat-containing protein n=1 Tax=Sciscionella sediminilitoris TaxID=1445613 RepID=UPI0004DF3128|nr:DUF4097 family beta strand repeat-containing protein [Sciscionella sp. SE31]